MGGQTRSAHDLESDLSIPPNPWWTAPSSGSAVGVSAGFAPISLGTETGGSLVYPASKAGLYAMRPTLGTVSAKGVFRISKSYDGIGAMARTPLDLSFVIEYILKPEFNKNFGKFLTKSWEGFRIGIVESTYGLSSDEMKTKWTSEPRKNNYENFVATVRGHRGYVLYPATPPEPSIMKYGGLVSRDIAYHEFNEVIQDFCDGFENPNVRSAKDIVKFNKENAELAMPAPHTNQKELIIRSESALANEQCSTARS